MPTETPDSNAVKPSLPPELERFIFQLTARLYKSATTKLVLVCKRAQFWVEPAIYEIVVITHSSCTKFLRTIETRPPEFFATNVKNLFLPGVGADPTFRILSVCTGVNNLACWSSTMPGGKQIVLPYEFPHRPRYLSIEPSDMFSQNPPEGPDFTHPFFEKVTHLQIVELWSLWTSSWRFNIIPNLTHLALGYGSGPGVGTVGAVRDVLFSCPNLEVLSLLVVADDEIPTVESAMISVCDDPRIVVQSYPKHDQQQRDSHRDGGASYDWEAFVNVEPNHWSKAEEVVLEQRRIRALVR